MCNLDVPLESREMLWNQSKFKKYIKRNKVRPAALAVGSAWKLHPESVFYVVPVRSLRASLWVWRTGEKRERDPGLGEIETLGTDFTSFHLSQYCPNLGLGSY